MKPQKFIQRSAVAAAVAVAFTAPALAHHGFGRFAVDTDVEYSGILTDIDFVNPHSYIYFDRMTEDGETLSMRCEMRAAILLRRSGWSRDMFEEGMQVTVEGHPHRDDPTACYVENLTLGDAPTINRNQQLSDATVGDTSGREKRLPSGVPNITGDWAVEQLVLTVPPEGGRGALVPKSLRDQYASGEITLEEIRSRNPRPSEPVYTEAGREFAENFEMWDPEDNPRLACRPTSIIYDWTFDWPVNRIEQKTLDSGERVIDITYGLYSFDRRIHMGMESHPEDLEPSYSGHSIGHWEDDTLVVDTVGFQEGVLAPPTPNSEQLHVVERFEVNLDAEPMSITRGYTATDPVYLEEPYTGQDTVYPSETPFEEYPCQDLTPEFDDR